MLSLRVLTQKSAFRFYSTAVSYLTIATEIRLVRNLFVYSLQLNYGSTTKQ